jgi:heme/copper-type cytochrome/quinol oxidase subunit 4
MRKFAFRFLGWVKEYFRENWGAPFVLGFMVLLVVAAVFLAVGLEWLANEVANYAYFALVAGAVLQLVCFLKFGEKGDDMDYG